MRPITRYRPSPAMVVASLALLVALGGVAFASIPGPGGTVKGCYSKSTGALRVIDSKKSCSRKRERALSWNQRGPQGLQGLQGIQGIQGVNGNNGNNGNNGSPAASMLTGRFAEPTDFASPTGTTDTATATVSAVDMRSPAATIVARDLSVSSEHHIDGTETITLTVNGANTSLSCSMDPSSPTCQDTTHAVTIPPGSTIAIHRELTNTTGVGTNNGILRFGWRATTP